MQKSRDAVANATFKATTLRNHVGVVSGDGGNVGVLAAGDGGLLVDSGYASGADHLWAQIQSLGVTKPAMLINTHWHFDHTDGNEALHQRGARIVAHERTQHWLSEPHTMAIPGILDAGTFPPAPKSALPTETLTTEKTIQHGGETVRLRYYPKAHTDSDIAVHFENANVLHTGDLFFNGFYPFIDPTTGGRLRGMAEQGRGVLKTTDKDTIIIPGHGPIGTQADYMAFITMLEAISDKVQSLKASGKTLDDVIAAKPTAAFDAKYAKGIFTPDQFARLAYEAS